MREREREREKGKKESMPLMQPISRRIDRPASNERWQSGEFRSHVDRI